MIRDYKAGREFINEFYQATGRYNDALENLPDPSELPIMPEIHMRRKRLVEFRNNYHLLAQFAAFVCNTTVEKLCALDLMAYLGLLKTSEEDYDYLAQPPPQEEK